MTRRRAAAMRPMDARSGRHCIGSRRRTPCRRKSASTTRSSPGPIPARTAIFIADLNPDSLEILTGSRVEPALAAAAPGETVQFERQGYFCADLDSTPDRLVFNRTVGLRDSWAKARARGRIGILSRIPDSCDTRSALLPGRKHRQFRLFSARNLTATWPRAARPPAVPVADRRRWKECRCDHGSSSCRARSVAIAVTAAIAVPEMLERRPLKSAPILLPHLPALAVVALAVYALVATLMVTASLLAEACARAGA